jgi:hypothetical protein
MFTQKITPNPFGPKAEEGMCLQYVRQTFGLPVRYGSATEAWANSPTKHRDRDYPKGVWFPVWWALDKNVNGHVALVAPDGRVYSTSNLNPNPLKVHPNVADVEAYYARYGFTLTYRGWTEDVAGYPVIAYDGIAAQGTTTTPEDDELFTLEAQAWLKENMFTKADGAYQNDRLLNKSDGAYMNNTRDAQFAAIMAGQDKALTKEDGGYIVRLVESTRPGAEDPEAAADNILKILPEAIAAKVVALLGQKLGAK